MRIRAAAGGSRPHSLRASFGSRLAMPKPKRLKPEIASEQRDIDEVPAVEPPRFAQQTEKPFQAVALHPAGGLPFPAGMEVECCSDADQCRCPDSLDVLRHPAFLFRCA